MKYLKLIFNRVFVFGLMILIQVVYMLLMLNKFSHYSQVWSVICMILSILVVLFIVNKEDNPAYKIAWIIPILLFPIFGGLLYLFLGNKKPTRKMRGKLEKEHDRNHCIRVQDKNVIKDFYKATTFFQKYVIIVTQNNRRAGFVLFPAGNPVCERRGFG